MKIAYFDQRLEGSAPKRWSKYTTNQLKINYQLYTSLTLSFLLFLNLKSQLKCPKKLSIIHFCVLLSCIVFNGEFFTSFVLLVWKLGCVKFPKFSNFKKKYFWGSCKMKHMTAHRFASKSGQTLLSGLLRYAYLSNVYNIITIIW